MATLDKEGILNPSSNSLPNISNDFSAFDNLIENECGAECEALRKSILECDKDRVCKFGHLKQFCQTSNNSGICSEYDKLNENSLAFIAYSTNPNTAADYINGKLMAARVNDQLIEKLSPLVNNFIIRKWDNDSTRT